jgi:hypothetical protein
MAASVNSSWAPRGPQPKSAEPQDALQVREAHLDLFAFTARLLECFGSDKRSGDIAGTLMNVAWNFADGGLGAASGFM